MNGAVAAGQPPGEPAGGQIPDLDTPVVVAGGQRFTIGTYGECRHRLAGDRCEAVFSQVLWAAPDLDFSMRAGSQQIAIGTEGERMNN